MYSRTAGSLKKADANYQPNHEAMNLNVMPAQADIPPSLLG
jgi:hypothetical protein